MTRMQRHGVGSLPGVLAERRPHLVDLAVAGNARRPRWRSGPNGWSRNSNAVAMPKFHPAPRRPQKSSGSSVCGRADVLPVGRDELDGGEVVDREPEVPLQPTHAAAQRQPGDPV